MESFFLLDDFFSVKKKKLSYPQRLLSSYQIKKDFIYYECGHASILLVDSTYSIYLLSWINTRVLTKSRKLGVHVQCFRAKKVSITVGHISFSRASFYV